MTLTDFEQALEGLVRGKLEAVVADGRASIDVRDESARGGPSRVISVAPTRASACPVTVAAQSDREISLFLGPPHNQESMTVDVFDRDREQLFRRVDAYLDAVLAGRLQVEAREGSKGGRLTFFLLADDEPQVHYYNALSRFRLRSWTVHRFNPY